MNFLVGEDWSEVFREFSYGGMVFRIAWVSEYFFILCFLDYFFVVFEFFFLERVLREEERGGEVRDCKKSWF